MQPKSLFTLSTVAAAALIVVLQPNTQNWIDAQAKLASLQAQLTDSQAEVQNLLEDNTELQLTVARRDRALSKAQDQQRELAATINAQPAPVLCCMDGRLMLHFRDESTQIESFYDASLADFAEAVRALPGAVVEISGHADHRGEREVNLELSQERVHAVQERLRTLGLREVAFHTTANGDAAPLIQGSQGNVEDEANAFYERRVELRLVNAGSQQISMR
jgi:outer membrane protein OmpA-like peptidoglycan-associated protein